ncbi:hypothetical protein NL676_016431 [Syzygium grande]|nr:hypothetical protein NL676_016431 [Syzygium grande]
MPCSSIGAATGGGSNNGSLRIFKLNESTFLASLMPKKEIGADRFVEDRPEYDGRGAVIAIFDSGVDPAAAGLQATSDGKPKILDVLDCTGSGDIDTSNVVKADANGSIRGASGAALTVNASWKNPSGDWHVGCKLVYELFTDTLTSRLKKERKKKWDERNQEAIANAVKIVDEFDQYGTTEKFGGLLLILRALKMTQIEGNLLSLNLLLAIGMKAFGVYQVELNFFVADHVLIHLCFWNLEFCFLMGDTRISKSHCWIERKFGMFSKLDACTFVANVYDDGNILSIVTDSSPHGTHVAGIATAFHPEEPLLNGVAPGAQLISCKIGDSRLGSMETGTGLIRALIAAVEHKCDLINMSYGEPSLLPDYGRFVDLANEVWSSRGPTVDGDLGVCISAPGGAVAPVPTWTLQRRMLMNGTSMASPSACGGVALLISAMKAEGIPVSPYTVRKALENTCLPVGSLPEDKLTTGQGLMQVDKFGFLLEALDFSYDHISEFIVVDPSNLSSGLHYYEVYGVDCKSPWRGPLFRIPVTITKPAVVVSRPPVVTYSKMSFQPGHIERRYIEVPFGATWVEATMRTSEFDTTRRFTVDTVQLCPLQRPIKWESMVTFSSPAAKSFAFPVVGGHTMELAVAQFWSSGIGSNEATLVDFEMVFHGIDINKEEVILDGSEAPVRIDAEALLASEQLAPVATLNKLRVPYRPVEAKLRALPSARDKLPSGKQILALTLTYKFKLEDGAELKPYIPLLNNRIYDTKFESQFYMIWDVNKRVHAMGDVYPESSKLPKGEYTLQLYLRHDNVHYLEKMKQLVLFIEGNLEEKDAMRLSFFSQPDGPVMGNGSYDSSVLIPGKKEAIYLGPPNKDKIPKNSQPGSVLVGAISYGKVSNAGQDIGKSPTKNPASYRISYIVPPNKVEEEKGKVSSSRCTKSVWERLQEEVRDAKIKFLGTLKQGNDEEKLEWKDLVTQLKSEYPKHTLLLAKILEYLLAQSDVKDKIHQKKKIIDAADEVIGSIDRDELGKYFAFKSDPEDEDAENIKKKMETTRDQLAEALYQKGLAVAEIEFVSEEKASAEATAEGSQDVAASGDEPVQKPGVLPNLFEENFEELKKWVDAKSSKYGTLLVIREQRHGRLGTALKVLNDMIQEDVDPPKKKLFELKLTLLEEIGWIHLLRYEREWMHVRFPACLPLF